MPRDRRLEADRERPQRGDRDADRRRVGARHRARPVRAEIGADDYLVKPFSMKELVARVKANARRGTRAEQEQRGEAIELEELRIDPAEVQAHVHGQSAGPTPTKFRLLGALALETGWS